MDTLHKYIRDKNLRAFKGAIRPGNLNLEEGGVTPFEYVIELYLHDEDSLGVAKIMLQALINEDALAVFGPWPPTPLGAWLHKAVQYKPKKAVKANTIVTKASKTTYAPDEEQELIRIAQELGVRVQPISRLALRIISVLRQ